MSILDTIDEEVTPKVSEPETVGNLALVAQKAEAFAIANDEDEARAIELTKAIKDAAKKSKAEQDSLTEGARQTIERIKSVFAGPLAKLDAAEKILKARMLEYHRKKQVEADRIAAEARKKQLEQIEAMKNAEPGALPPPPVVIPEAPQKTTRSGAASRTIRKVKVARIVDEALLPREWLVPDEVRIRKAALAGVVIPGVEVVEEEQMSIR